MVKKIARVIVREENKDDVYKTQEQAIEKKKKVEKLTNGKS